MYSECIDMVRRVLKFARLEFLTELTSKSLLNFRQFFVSFHSCATFDMWQLTAGLWCLIVCCCFLRHLVWFCVLWTIVVGVQGKLFGAHPSLGLYMYNNEMVGQPPPAHTGIPPLHVDPKTGTYKSLCAAVTITSCATVVNTQTHIHRHTQKRHCNQLIWTPRRAVGIRVAEWLPFRVV